MSGEFKDGTRCAICGCNKGTMCRWTVDDKIFWLCLSCDNKTFDPEFFEAVKTKLEML